MKEFNIEFIVISNQQNSDSTNQKLILTPKLAQQSKPNPEADKIVVTKNSTNQTLL